jgi:TonB family protein
MKHLQLAIGYALCLAFFAAAGCRPKPKSQIVGEPSPDQPPSSPIIPSPTQQPSSSPSSSHPSEIKADQVQSLDLPKLANSVQPAVILVTVFDSSGKLLRSDTGFFISDDGRFVTTARAIDNGVNAVAKTANGGIYNVAGIFASSASLDLAILKADAKRVPFLPLSKNGKTEVGARVGVIGSALAGSEGAPREGAIAAKQPESQGDRLEIAMPMSASSAGSPVVDESGEVVGIVASAGEKTIVTSASAVTSLQSQIAPDATARWAKTSGTSPSPRPTPKPRLVYAPQPEFPSEARNHSGISRSGRFRVSFDAHGNARNVQIIQSTGNGLLDQATIGALRQWKSTPGDEWFATVPITFQDR